jgi:cytochrome c
MGCVASSNPRPQNRLVQSGPPAAGTYSVRSTCSAPFRSPGFVARDCETEFSDGTIEKIECTVFLGSPECKRAFLRPLSVASKAVASTSSVAETTNVDAVSVMKRANCSSCHHETLKILGPSFSDIALRYRGTSDLVKVSSCIRNGCRDGWGKLPMPAQAVTPLEASAIATWILSKH